MKQRKSNLFLVDKEKRRIYFIIMKIKRIFRNAFIPVLFLLLFLSHSGSITLSSNLLISGESQPPQNPQRKEDNYMTRLLSRNTKQLGLKDYPKLQKYLSQSSIKWAIRSGKRYLLN